MRSSWLIASMLLVLGGCSYRLFLDVSGSLEAPTVRINAPGFAGADCFSRFKVTTGGPEKAVQWESQSVNGACVELTEITYGLIPSDFVELRPARPLEPGVIYQATAYRRGASGDLDFVYFEGAWRAVE